MTNLLATQRATLNGDFVSKVQAAMIISSVAIRLAGTSANPQYRDGIADRILRNPEGGSGFLTQFLWLAAANPVISSSVSVSGVVDATDEQIETAVNEVWDILYPMGSTQGGQAEW